MQRAVLRGKVEVGDPGLAIFRFNIEKPLEFQAGQYTTIGLELEDDLILRPFSIASSPAQRNELEFYAVRVDSGELTPSLFSLLLGQTVYYLGAKGSFTLGRTTRPNLVMIATGTGLAPFISMLRTLEISVQAGEPVLVRHIVVMHGVSFSNELGYRQELEELVRRRGKFEVVYVPCVSRPTPADSEFSHGRVNDVVRLLLGEPKSGKVDPVLGPALSRAAILQRLVPQETAIYLCGNPEMIRDIQSIAGLHGYDDVFKEDFW